MRAFHAGATRFTELPALPEALVARRRGAGGAALSVDDPPGTDVGAARAAGDRHQPGRLREPTLIVLTALFEPLNLLSGFLLAAGRLGAFLRRKRHLGGRGAH